MTYNELLATRRFNFNKLTKKHNAWSISNWYGCSPSYISQLRTGARPITERTARKLEHVCGLRPKALDRVSA